MVDEKCDRHTWSVRKTEWRYFMDIVVIIGYIAGVLTTISFVPQVIRTWKLKETKDFSLVMLLLFAAGMLLWTVYGIWINSIPIIAANIVTFGLVLLLLWMKVKSP
jgi:MtN3 and saliva related transmembrane protein